ncbi:protocadherin gamma-A10-like [Porphyrio hochstetteri]
MFAAGRRLGRRERALLWCVLVAVWGAARGQLRYSLLEEMPKGSFVGDVAKDLGLDLTALRQRGVRIIDRSGTQYFDIHGQTGHLVTAGRIDREQLCDSVQQCVLRCEVLVEGEMQVHGIEVEITDINDNAPSFQDAETELRMSETTAPGSRFPLRDAQDPDVGANSLQSYELSGDEHFSLAVQAGPGGHQRPELVLAKALDREQAAFHELVLRASDGGEPARTGTARIRVAVLDANDNAPVFSQAEYTVRVPEDVPVGSTLVTLTATDADEGLNGHVQYSFKKITKKASQIFQLESETGAVMLMRPLDFEEAALHELEVQAHDGGGLSDTTKVSITVTDVNDNAPEVTVTSHLNAISEDAPAGTVVALLHVQDRDSGPNGEVRCSIAERLPFRLEKSFEDYYRVVTARELDREEVSEYNVTVRAADGGSPALRSGAVLALRVLDVNDNAPVFAEARYSARVPENNAAGALVLTVRARDADWGQNARVRYRLWEGRVRGAPLSSYVSVQAETGALYALRSFDYEEVREVGLWVLAEDGGAPALSSNVSVRLVIVDENDNAPQVLYPPAAPGAGWAGVELAPRSAEPGALVAKVVAVDADAGQNAWLSYELAKATEPGLFRVGLHSGEVRTARFPLARDAARQSLVVLVKDRGRPALSATATLTVVLAESVAELLAELGSAAAAAAGPGEAAGSLTRWLVVAVAAVSCLFLAFLLLLLALRLRRWRRSQLLPPAGSGALRGVPASHFVGIDGVRAFLHSYSHEVSLTADSRKSQLRLSGGSCCDTLPARPAPDEPAPLLGEDPAAAPVSSSGRACSTTALAAPQPLFPGGRGKLRRGGRGGSRHGGRREEEEFDFSWESGQLGRNFHLPKLCRSSIKPWLESGAGFACFLASLLLASRVQALHPASSDSSVSFVYPNAVPTCAMSHILVYNYNEEELMDSFPITFLGNRLFLVTGPWVHGWSTSKVSEGVSFLEIPQLKFQVAKLWVHQVPPFLLCGVSLWERSDFQVVEGGMSTPAMKAKKKFWRGPEYIRYGPRVAKAVGVAGSASF